jgi:hypothetical protein
VDQKPSSAQTAVVLEGIAWNQLGLHDALVDLSGRLK